jgi:hypothetical protein
MKTFLECVKEAASVRRLKDDVTRFYFELPQEMITAIEDAADMYAKQSNSHKPVVVREGDKEYVIVHGERISLERVKEIVMQYTPNEPLPAEGLAQNGCGGHLFQRTNEGVICIYCGVHRSDV